MTENKKTHKEKKTLKEEKSLGNELIAVIRIRGRVGVKGKIAEGLKRLGLKTKYSCVVLKGTEEQKGMLKSLRDSLAYGKISKEDFKELLKERAKPVNGNEKKPSPDTIIKGFEEGKKLKEMNIQPVFRLHPPRKGIESKQRYPQGVLGDHQEKINELLKRML